MMAITVGNDIHQTGVSIKKDRRIGIQSGRANEKRVSY